MSLIPWQHRFEYFSEIAQNGSIYPEIKSDKMHLSFISTWYITLSSGSTHERKIVTTDLKKGCTEGHTGTSASAPIGQFFYLVTYFCDFQSHMMVRYFLLRWFFSVCLYVWKSKSSSIWWISCMKKWEPFFLTGDSLTKKSWKWF